MAPAIDQDRGMPIASGALPLPTSASFEQPPADNPPPMIAPIWPAAVGAASTVIAAATAIVARIAFGHRVLAMPQTALRDHRDGDDLQPVQPGGATDRRPPTP